MVAAANAHSSSGRSATPPPAPAPVRVSNRRNATAKRRQSAAQRQAEQARDDVGDVAPLRLKLLRTEGMRQKYLKLSRDFTKQYQLSSKALAADVDFALDMEMHAMHQQGEALQAIRYLYYAVR